MLVTDMKSLSDVRYEHAQEDLKAAELLLEKEQYKSAVNCSYYSIFHAIRAVLAYDGIDTRPVEAAANPINQQSIMHYAL